MPDVDDSSSCSSGATSDDDGSSPSDRDWDDWKEGQGAEASNTNAAVAAASDDNEETATASLFDSSVVLPSASAALAHDKRKHGFDLVDFRKKVKEVSGGKEGGY